MPATKAQAQSQTQSQSQLKAVQTQTGMLRGTDRVEMLRTVALNKNISSFRGREASLLYLRGWTQAAGSTSLLMRRARAKATIFRNATPVISKGELIVGKPSYRQLTEDETTEYRALNDAGGKFLPRTGGQESHMAIDYEKLLKLGVTGVIDEVKRLNAALDMTAPEDIEKNEFYRSCLEVLDALLVYADNYAAQAEKLAAESEDEAEKQELLEIGRIMRQVPRYKATTFREALQSVHFVTFCLEGLYQLGRPDRYMVDLYRQDIKNGSLTEDFAQELIDCLCIMFSEYIGRGLAVGFMVGGRDAAGRDVTNELTWLFIKSIGHTRLSYPGIGLCWNSDTPRDLMRYSAQLLSHGLSHPALFNDDVISRGLRYYGLPDEEACEYIHCTCVEITPCKGSASWVASPYINMVETLVKTMGIENGVQVRECGAKTFEEFVELYKSNMSEKIRQEVMGQNRAMAERWHAGGDPLVSCFVNDCLAKGKDIDRGGARHNWIMPSFVGLANLVDSFTTIREFVYKTGKVTMKELADAISNDFVGHETLRLEIENKLPKYGNDIDEVDALADDITAWIVDEYKKYTNYRGDKFIPSLFCWIMHSELGKQTIATPDGRHAGEALGDGSGPAQGRERKGPTASVISSTKWDHYPFVGGIAVNLKFTKSVFNERSLEKMMSLIDSYMQRGGFELQINVVDTATLLAAQKEPDKYRDLVVRIGGYSDYFTRLSPQMQAEVIKRTEHSI